MIIPSVFTTDTGTPEFEMLISRPELRDPGVNSLYFRETRTVGFEYASRAFIHAHLEPEDLFIDIGAHFGLYTLTAAMKYPGKVKVLAIEPHPANIKKLKLWTEFNKCSGQVSIAECAASDHSGFSLLNQNSSMGHSLVRFSGGPSSGEPLNVELATLDRIVEKSKLLEQGQRIFLKIDTEGHELSVIKGALNLIKKGQVAAVIWEKGLFHGTEKGAKELTETISLLRDLGYRSYRFPHEDMGGPLVPYVPSHEQCNIISIDRSIETLPVYEQPWKAHTILPASMRPRVSSEFMIGYTNLLIEKRSTDCGRWSRWDNLISGADLRAGIAGQMIPEKSTVLDAGAGLMLLRDYIPENSKYIPLDIVPRNRKCLVADLNQQQYPDRKFDTVCALFLFEFLHDLKSFMDWARQNSAKLVFTYHCLLPGTDKNKRRAAGFFNDYKINELEELITGTGWTATSRIDIGNGQICFECI